MLGLLLSTAGVEAKTSVTLDGTTITFDVPIVIFVPVEFEPSGPEEKKQLRQHLVEEVENSRSMDQMLAESASGFGGPFYRNCYTVVVKIHASVRFQSDDSLPGASDHALAFARSQQGREVVWTNSVDPYSAGLWGSWNPEVKGKFPTLGAEDLLHVTFRSSVQAMADVLGKQAEKQLGRQGIKLPGCFCVCRKSVSILKHQFGEYRTESTYEIPVAADGKGGKLKGYGRGVVKGNGVSGSPPVEARHEVRSLESATGTYRRRVIELSIDADQTGEWITESGGGTSQTLNTTYSWTLVAGPLDDNGYYYNRKESKSGDTTTVTTLKVQRCEQATRGGCVSE